MTATLRSFIGACISLIIAACGDPTGLPPGSIRVNVTTAGPDHDNDGYELSVGPTHVFIPATFSVRFDGLPGGSHDIELSRVAANCTVIGDNPRSVIIESGAVTNVDVGVQCHATGIQIEVRTISPDLPVRGYTVTAAGRVLATKPNETLTISRLPVGSHVLTVTVPDDCTVAGGASFPVTVVNRVVTPVTIEITCAPYEDMIAFSLDSVRGGAHSNWIAVTRAAEGTLPTPLFQGVDPSWSPDGRKLVYSTTYCDLYYGQGCSGGLAIVDYGNAVHSAPEHFRNGVQPAWSPDGNTIAFLQVSPGGPSILTVAGIDGPAVGLPVDFMYPSDPSWSPDGERIVFACAGPSVSGRDVCSIKRDGTGFLRLTNDEWGQYTPAWSPDGSRIAFVTRPNSTSYIAVMNPDGTDLRQLVPGFEPSWSPDGSKLVFSRGDGLFVMDSDGSSVTRISTGSHHAPTWRP